MDRISILRECTLLSSFTDVGVKILSSIAEPATRSAGESLFRQGEAADTLWIIGSGEASILLDREDGEVLSVGSVGAGEVVGEVGLLSAGGQHMITLIATEDLEGITIKRSDLSALQRKKPQACLKLLMVISRQLGRRLAKDSDALRRLLAASVPKSS